MHHTIHIHSQSRAHSKLSVELEHWAVQIRYRTENREARLCSMDAKVMSVCFLKDGTLLWSGAVLS